MLSIQELVVGTVAITDKGKIAVIMEHRTANTKYPIIYKTSTNSQTYKACLENFACVVGEVDVEDFKEACNATLVPNKKSSIPEELRDFDIGDMIEILGASGKKQVAEYRGYNSRRPKNCVSIRMNGKDYKGPLSIVVGKAK